MHSSIYHSAKGSTWKNHKYLRKEDGRYYYSSKEYADEYRSNNGGKSKPITNKDTPLQYTPGYKNPKKGAVTNNTKGAKPYTPSNQKKTVKPSTTNARTAGAITNKSSVSKRQYTPSPSIKKNQTTSYGVAKAREEYYTKTPAKKVTNNINSAIDKAKNKVVNTASSAVKSVTKKINSAIDKVKNTNVATRTVKLANQMDPNLDKKKGKTKTKRYAK